MSGITLTHSQAVNRLDEIETEMARLAEKPALTPEDETYRETLRSEYDDTDQYRARLEQEAAVRELQSRREARTGRTATGLRVEAGAASRHDYDRDAILEPDSIEAHRFKNPWDMSEVRTFGRDPGEVTAEFRSRALSAVEKMQSANDVIRAAATDLVERWDNANGDIARMVLATSSPEYLRAWSKTAVSPLNPDLSESEQRALNEARSLQRAMSLTDSAGGYLVPFQLDPTVIITANGSVNQVREVARKVVATGDVWHGVSSGAVAWSWDAEAAEVSDDATTFAEPAIPIYKAAGFVPISLEARQDAANVAQEVGRLLAFGKDVLEAAAFITGSGSGQPTGIVTALAGGSSEVAPATPETFALADIYALDGALPARYRRNASWLANRGIYNRVRQFDTSGGAGLWERVGNGLPPNLLGRPALEAEDMDASWNVAATAANYVGVFGDFDNYVIADRIGMTVDFIPHLFGNSNRPTGQSGWYAYYRVGADSVNDAAFRMLNLATTA